MVAFKTHSNLILGWEAGRQSEPRFQEIGLCFSLSTVSQNSLIESSEVVIENTISPGPTPGPENKVFPGKGPEIWFKKQ